MRSFATRSWTDATLSIYAATIGDEGWMRLDNASLRKTPGQATVGTECIEPAEMEPLMAFVGSMSAPSGGGAAQTTSGDGTAGWDWTAGWAPAEPATLGAGDGAWIAQAEETGTETLSWMEPIDLRDATGAWLEFRSWLTALSAAASVEVSVGGGPWQPVAVVPATEDWVHVTVDLSGFAGELVYVRFVLESWAGILPGRAPDTWRVEGVSVHRPPPD
jgi:hypothetical protein